MHIMTPSSRFQCRGNSFRTILTTLIAVMDNPVGDSHGSALRESRRALLTSKMEVAQSVKNRFSNSLTLSAYLRDSSNEKEDSMSHLSQELQASGIARVIVFLKQEGAAEGPAKLRHLFSSSELSQASALGSGSTRKGKAHSPMTFYPHLGILYGTADRHGVALLRAQKTSCRRALRCAAPQYHPAYACGGGNTQNQDHMGTPRARRSRSLGQRLYGQRRVGRASRYGGRWETPCLNKSHCRICRVRHVGAGSGRLQNLMTPMSMAPTQQPPLQGGR